MHAAFSRQRNIETNEDAGERSCAWSPVDKIFEFMIHLWGEGLSGRIERIKIGLSDKGKGGSAERNFKLF